MIEHFIFVNLILAPLSYMRSFIQQYEYGSHRTNEPFFVTLFDHSKMVVSFDRSFFPRTFYKEYVPEGGIIRNYLRDELNKSLTTD